MQIHPYSANQCLPILETHYIPLEDIGRTIPIPVPLIYIVESVPETLLFGSPPFELRLRTRPLFLLLAPSNARYDGIGCICHGSSSIVRSPGQQRCQDIETSNLPSSRSFVECQDSPPFQSLDVVGSLVPRQQLDLDKRQDGKESGGQSVQPRCPAKTSCRAEKNGQSCGRERNARMTALVIINQSVRRWKFGVGRKPDHVAREKCGSRDGRRCDDGQRQRLPARHPGVPRDRPTA